MSEHAERSRRLFFALWPSDELRHDIEHETQLAATCSGGRVIPSRNFHITLAFLGLVPEPRIVDVMACATIVKVQHCELIFGRLRWWQPQELLCLEPISGAAALMDLVSRLRTALQGKGFAVEYRPFRPHVTLAREVRREPAIKPIRDLHWQVKRLELIESQTAPTASVYTIVPT